MGEVSPGPKQSRWEIIAWLSLAAAGVTYLAGASAAVEVVWGVGLLALCVATFLWSRRIRRTRSYLLRERLPIELVWVIAALAVFVAAGVIVEAQIEGKLTSAFLAIGLLTMLIADRTRELPPDEGQIAGDGGYFDFTTKAGRARRHRAISLAYLLVAIITLVIGIASHESIAFFLSGLAIFSWLSFEIVSWIARRRKWGANALDDESDGLS